MERSIHTVALRLLGSDRHCTQAIQDMERASLTQEERLSLLHLVAALRLAIARDKNIPDAQKGPFTMTDAWQEVERITQSALDQGLKEGEALGLRQNIQDLCQLLGISLGARRRAQLNKMDLDPLRELRAHIMAHRSWPS